jgi:hypothetical protein
MADRTSLGLLLVGVLSAAACGDNGNDVGFMSSESAGAGGSATGGQGTGEQATGGGGTTGGSDTRGGGSGGGATGGSDTGGGGGGGEATGGSGTGGAGGTGQMTGGSSGEQSGGAGGQQTGGTGGETTGGVGGAPAGGSAGTSTGGTGLSTPCPEVQPEDGADCAGSEGTVCEYEPNVRCSCPVPTGVPVTPPVWDCVETGEPIEPGQCSTDADCRLWSDCCGCFILEPGEQADPCPDVCDQDVCAVLGISEQDVACHSGHCGIVSTCNVEEVTCDVPPPDCAEDELPSVVNGCWGPCVHATSFCVSAAT